MYEFSIKLYFFVPYYVHLDGYEMRVCGARLPTKPYLNFLKSCSDGAETAIASIRRTSLATGFFHTVIKNLISQDQQRDFVGVINRNGQATR